MLQRLPCHRPAHEALPEVRSCPHLQDRFARVQIILGICMENFGYDNKIRRICGFKMLCGLYLQVKTIHIYQPTRLQNARRGSKLKSYTGNLKKKSQARLTVQWQLQIHSPNDLLPNSLIRNPALAHLQPPTASCHSHGSKPTAASRLICSLTHC